MPKKSNDIFFIYKQLILNNTTNYSFPKILKPHFEKSNPYISLVMIFNFSVNKLFFLLFESKLLYYLLFACTREVESNRHKHGAEARNVVPT